MSYRSFTNEEPWDPQVNPKKRSLVTGDDSPETEWRMKSNTELVQGVLRIRNFRVDYLDGPVADADIVIADMPCVRAQRPGSTREYTSLKRLKDFDHIETRSSFGSEHSQNAGEKTGKSGQRSRRNAIRKSRATEEMLDALNEEFEHIQVYKAPVALGKFDPEIHFAPPDPAVLNYLYTDEGRVENFQPHEHCFMLANGGAQMKHLKMYDQPTLAGPDFDNLEDPEAGRVALEHAVDFVQDLLRLDTLLPRLDERAAENVRYDPTKSAGVHYRLKGLKTRGEAYEVALAEAKVALVALFSGEYIEPRPTRMGGRGKPVSMSEQRAREENVIKGRAIHMTDTRDHIILGFSEQPLNDAWKDDRFPVSVGRGWMHGDATRFAIKHQGGGHIYCFDAEKFDASLMPWLIHVSITIMRMQFERGLDHDFDMYWQFVEESLLHSFVFRDDGIIFEKRHGTSSGHNHNSLAQSIATCIMAAFHTFYLNRALPVAVIRRNLTFEGLGDDNITVETAVLEDETVEKRAQRNWEVFGVSWGGEKSFEVDTLVGLPIADHDWDESAMYGTAQYLGKYFRFAKLLLKDGHKVPVVLPYRPLKETIVRLLYPEHIGNWTSMEEFLAAMEKSRGGRLRGHFIDGSGNPLTRKWLNGWWDWASSEGFKFPEGEDHALQARWERLGVDVDNGLALECDDFESWPRIAS
ncbi:RNA-dependent RNA polymerase [Rhizoctonia solani dsRNA virus 1]|uniref:RNA-dependent RNA polymerase n=1 Tax=Rhizoctonia solani dsRNA virus 1 TaxID=1265605 RepID=L0BCE7_9VIRU|nr:RNA-dependent RNA polymerase [Rhizoctonia solani dsRNA virus 1]AFZ85210.1 RNA-dependent RNA polymerase [Rhizoctonia solani dsRNA virus 1]